MATYKDIAFLERPSRAKPMLDCQPGAVTPWSGIYRCMGCGAEVASIEGQPLPGEDDHQHAPGDPGEVRWRMIVAAIQYLTRGTPSAQAIRRWQRRQRIEMFIERWMPFRRDGRPKG
ncbi:hypothetical protein G3545_09960 [Starkeya sp. ORNL1]|uniref:hypothetical protein n=1 Tax=Starkeya sp. ORNL1 TaxID=2709380 RepID=UPI001462EA96|nr:hypothetical protein [Starkeya sp. ORNL1]QJP13945.1 hypothetical protein G3545_09960 [Starkeya sp. ORNL1]